MPVTVKTFATSGEAAAALSSMILPLWDHMAALHPLHICMLWQRVVAVKMGLNLIRVLQGVLIFQLI